MRDVLIAVAVLLILFLLFSVVFMVGLYWTHYPYGRRKKWRRKR